MRRVYRFISSPLLSVVLILVFVLAQMVATFMPTESDSWRYVYGTAWFEAIMWAIGVNLTAVLFRYKTYRKLPIFLLHLSMIIILIGAAVTRYAGCKGMMHIREHESSSEFVITDRANPDIVKTKHLNFKIRLDKFVIKHYPGSMQPSSYDSYVTVLNRDGKKLFSYHIYMNHILVYKGYRFYQASYDKDEKGTILSVSYDPGMYITYLGYFMLTLGFILSAFYPRSRLVGAIKALSKSAAMMAVVLLVTHAAYAFSIEEFAKHSKNIANQFSTILTQHNGRIEPMDTLDLDIVHKLTGKSTLYGLTYNQIIVGMVAFPEEFQKLPMIYISDSKIRKAIGIKGKYASYNDFFDAKGNFRFLKEIGDAFHTPDSERTKQQRDWLKLNDVIYVAYMVYSGDVFRIFPAPNSKKNNYRWYSPVDIERLLEHHVIDPYGAKFYLELYSSLVSALRKLDAKSLAKVESRIYNIQKAYSGEILPSKNRIKWEILYNRLQIFAKLIGVYTLIGLLAIGLGFLEIFRRKRYKGLDRALIALGAFALLVHSANMIVRWYIAGHAPWSDAYESIIFIAWGAAFASVVFFRRSMLSLGSGLFVAGMFMMVANLDNINPQITNIVPVLNSYWLLIHVAFSIVSYGFLAVGSMLGLLNLILYGLRKYRQLDDQIEQFNNIILITIYVGLAMLSIGTIFGAVWANESWGAYWSWDPKETWSLISILVYAFVLHRGIMYSSKDGFLFSLLSFLSFFFIMMTYFGVNFYIAQGLHSYGRGSAAYIWFYVLEAGIVLWYAIVIINMLVDAFFRKRVGTPSS